MSKYYRVRTQEQWYWLVNRFGQSETQWPERGMTFEEIHECLASGGFVIVHNDYLSSMSSVLYTAVPQNNGNVIEVSDLMEESKMKDYVTISRDNLDHVRFIENNSGFAEHNKISNVRELRIPKSLLYPKVRMTEAEKKEFDDIKKHVTALYNAMVLIFEHRDECINLNNKLFYSAPPKYLNDVQRDFARAWADPSLIDVIPEKKYWVKCYPTDDCYFYKYDGRILAGVPRVHLERFQFTTDEIVEYHLDGTENIFEKVEVSE